MTLASYPQPHEFSRDNGLLTHASVLEMSGSAGATNAQPSLTLNHLTGGDRMAHEAHNASIDSAQYQDPLIVNARLVNLAAEIERNLAARRALRPARSAAARLGWERRK
jgi:hypothetical protein